MKQGKRYAEAAKLVDSTKLYEAKEAFDIIEKMPKAKFDETVELHVKLGVDSKHAEQQVRGTVVLPHGTGKTLRVLVFAKGDKATEAEKAGADFVGAEELIPKIEKENWFEYDVIVATPDMMGVVGRLGRVLGPKGLMPNPKSGTVTMDVTKAINDIKSGKVEYRLDKTNIIHLGFGKVSFGTEKLLENYETIINAIIKAKPAAAKGQVSIHIAPCSAHNTPTESDLIPSGSKPLPEKIKGENDHEQQLFQQRFQQHRQQLLQQPSERPPGPSGHGPVQDAGRQ